MEYTEEVKKEADGVVEKYYKPMFMIGETLREILSNELAIQDRQSVLEELTNIKFNLIDPINQGWSYTKLQEKIQSLTQQIEYLKTKI